MNRGESPSRFVMNSDVIGVIQSDWTTSIIGRTVRPLDPLTSRILFVLACFFGLFESCFHVCIAMNSLSFNS